MAKLTEEMKSLIQRVHIGYVATSDREGRPNVAPKVLMVLDDDTLLYPEIHHYVERTRTLRNVEENPNVAIAIIEPLGKGRAKGYQFVGKACVHYAGKVYDELSKRLKATPHLIPGPGKLVAAVTVKVEDVYSHAPEEAGKKLTTKVGGG